MAAPDLGPWEPLGLEDLVDAFAAAPLRWWCTGGVALELHLGRSWRRHADTDIGIVRHEVGGLRSVLAEWDIHVAADGRLTRWAGEALSGDAHQNNLWCRRHVDGPWGLDVTITDGDEHSWVYRRDPTIRVAWADAVLRSASGVAYLAPELQLLFKSSGHRDKDDLDAREVIPELEGHRRDRLAHLLAPDHRWQSLLA